MFPLPVTLRNAGWQKSSIENVIILVVTFVGRGSISRDTHHFNWCRMSSENSRARLQLLRGIPTIGTAFLSSGCSQKFREPQIFPFTKPNHASMDSFTTLHKIVGPDLWSSKLSWKLLYICHVVFLSIASFNIC